MVCARILLIGFASGMLTLTGCSTFRQGAVLAATTAGGAGIGAAASHGDPAAIAAGAAGGALVGVGINAITNTEIRQKQQEAMETQNALSARERYFQQQDQPAGGSAPMGTQHYYEMVVPAQIDSYGVKRVPARVVIPINE
jgi:hypothetical protein